MADARSVVELVFEGVDKTSAATTAALKNVNDFGSSLSGTVAPLADFTAAALKFETALLATGAAVTVFAVKAAGDFDGAFREIATLIDQPIDALDEFRQSILDYGTSSTQSLEQVTQSVYSAISAGVDYTDSLGVVAQAEQLALAGRADLSESLLVLVSSLNAYGESAGQAQQYSDALFQTVKLGQTTLPELAQYLSQVTSTAATLKVPFETVLAAIATLTASGTPTAQAVTQINAALSALVKPSAEAQKISSELGIEFDAQAVKAKGLEVVLQEVATATGGNEEQMGRLFGNVEALRAVFPLTGSAAEKFAANLTAMSESAGSTAEAADKMAAAFSTSNQQISNALQGLLIEIGQPLLDEYGSVADGIVAIFNALGANVRDGELGGIVDYLEDLLGNIGETLQEFARNLPAALEGADLSGFTANIQGIVDGIASLFSGVDLGSPEGISTAIESIGGAIGALGEFTGNAIGAFSEIVTLLIDLGTYLKDVDGEWIALAGTVGGFSLLVAPVVTALSSIVTAALAAGPAFAAMSAGISATVTGLAAVAAPVTAAALGLASIYTSATDIVSALGQIDTANKRIEEFETQYSGQDSRIASHYADISEQLGYTVTSIGEFEAAVNAGALVFDDASGKWVSAINSVGDSAGGLVDTFGDGASSAESLSTALTAAFSASGYDIDPLTGAVRALSDGTQEAAESAVKAEDATRGYVIEMVDGIPTFRQFGAAAGGAFSDAQKSAEDALKASENYLIKMEEIASNERIAVIEAKFALDVAQVEADAQRIQATFESIDNTVNSTGTLIGELFGLAADAGSLREKFALEDQIEQENERRDAALELQKQLTEAEIRLLRARAQSLERGDAAITVDGAGLQPHLEAFMWEILRAVQVRVNQDGLDMLLGV